MKVLLINPPRYKGIPVVREDRCEITDRSSVIPPYSLMQLASILRENGHAVSILDANGENISIDEVSLYFSANKFDVVILRFTPTTFDSDLSCFKILKKINPETITIGICWTLQSKAFSVMSEADCMDIYVLGDNEYTVINAVNAIEKNGVSGLSEICGLSFKEKGQIIVNKPDNLYIDMDMLPYPAYDLIKFGLYYNNTKRKTRYMTMYTSKGCPNGCIFCTVRHTNYRAKSPQRVIKEIEILIDKYSVNEISFFDESFTYNDLRAREICELIISKNIKINWYCNVNSNKLDKELLMLMKKAGCKGISIGVESGSSEILRNIQKPANIEKAKEAIINAKKLGIKTFASFIVGLPGESWNTINETIKFLNSTLPHGAQFNVAVPYPNTPFYSLAKQENWINPINGWRNLYQDRANIRTDFMTSEELEKARRLLYKKLYFNPIWIGQNIWFLFKYPGDLPFAFKYYLRSLKNYFFYGLSHSH